MLDFNAHAQRELIARQTLSLHAHTGSEAFKKLQEVVTASRNIQLMELGSSVDGEAFRYAKGRLDAIQDIVDYFDLCKDERHCETIRRNMKATRGASIHSINKPFNT